MDFTQEQADAIYTYDRNLIVTAGAGSGKTRVLVERFTTLLDTHPDWALPSIVAITFTEKAAREMRDRVRSAIEDRIRVAAESGDAPGLNRWLEHRAALTRARIGTIHALCAALLRANPAEAHLDPSFEVLDENEAAILLDDAVDQALARLASEDHPEAALLAAYDLPDVRSVLRRYAGRGAVGALDLSPDGLLARWESDWRKAIGDLQAEVQSDADLLAALDFLRPGDLPPGDKLSAVWQAVFARREALLGGDPEACAAAVVDLAGSIRLNVGAASQWGGKERLDESKAALGFVRDRMKRLEAALLPRPGALDVEAAAWLVAWRDAILLAAEVYDDLKRHRNALDFDDLEALAQELLNHHPEVAAHCVEEFSHILVDEFQDTNVAQRDIIYQLAGVGTPGADGRLFVVGDPKQSIYAFRGADVNVFGEVRADLTRRGGCELPLSTSFRAHDALVGAFNDLFGLILRAGPGTAGRYEVERGQPMVAYRRSEAWHDRPLTVIALHKPDAETDPDRRFDAEELRRWEAWEIAQHLHGMVRGDVPVFDREKGQYRAMGYGDAALLFQSMTRVPVYEDVFKAAGLPYVTVAGKGYYDRQEVWDLLNLLRALHNPADDLALAAVLRSPLFGLSDDALFALRLARAANGERLPLWRALFDPESTPLFPESEAAVRDYACGTLVDLRDVAGRATIAELLSLALDRTGYLATLTGLPDGARRRGNVEKLVALARESGRVSLGAFLAYARDLTAREVREGEAAVEVEGAVTIMSVHASKGLEFPVVVLADASWNRSVSQRGVVVLDPDAGAACKLPTSDPDADDQPFAWEYASQLEERRDRAERRRLLYVGATRAQEHLIVSGSLHRCPAHAWLRQWLDALGVTEDDLNPSEEVQHLRYDWGGCMLVVPRTPPPPEALLPRRSEGASGWDHPAVAAGEAIDSAVPAWPPLLADVQADPHAPARSLTATQLAGLGHAPCFDPARLGRAAFRHSVLYDAPEPVRPLPDRPVEGPGLRRIVGEIVHRALRAWVLPGNLSPEVVTARLQTYAWEAGLTDEDQIVMAVTAALDLLRRFESSEVCAQVQRAGQVYRELPFMVRLGERTVHGQIDVLYFDRGAWHLLDYKTAPVSWHGAADSARRYYLQVGAYARAVEARTGQVPRTTLYYIHPGRLLLVQPEDWQPALDRLEDALQEALGPGAQGENR
jgi:ATP-dependent helicase/nuclease subunit A